MLRDPAFSRLFAECPVWLWPILAWSLLGIAEEVARLEAEGDTWFELRLTDWGWAYIVRARTRPLPTWKDELFRRAMGDPVPELKPEPPKFGLFTAEAQADWALEQFCDRRNRPGLFPGYGRLSAWFRRSRWQRSMAGPRPARSQSFRQAGSDLAPPRCSGVRAPPERPSLPNSASPTAPVSCPGGRRRWAVCIRLAFPLPYRTVTGRPARSLVSTGAGAGPA